MSKTTPTHVDSEFSEKGARRGRRADGEQSHRVILRAAAELASVEGLEGLSIGALADHVGLSKSGLYAHFGSKEELQLQTIDAAMGVFDQEVIRPALVQPAGLPRLRALAHRFLDHVERGTFPGGCFFASVGAEVDSRPGPLRDRLAAIHRDWAALFERSVVEAQASGDLEPGAEAGQVAFEILAMLAGAHASFLLQGQPAVLGRARDGIEVVLAAHGAPR